MRRVVLFVWEVAWRAVVIASLIFFFTAIGLTVLQFLDVHTGAVCG